jgi:hypothetical protein
MPIKQWLATGMSFVWKRKLPAGEPLKKEAERLGVSLAGSHKYIDPITKRNIVSLDDAELQERVLAARTDRRSAALNLVQTVAIVCTLIFYVYSLHVQSNEKSAEFMLAFDQRLNSGGSALVVKALDRNGNLDKANVGDDELEDFLDKYELLDAAYRHDIIRRDMAYDAFSYDLETALRDPKVRRFISESRGEEADFYDGVIELAKSFGIDIPAPAAHASPVRIVPPSAAH